MCHFITLVSLLAASLAASGAQGPVGSGRWSLPREWDEVLRISRSRDPANRKELEKIVERDKDAAHAALARTILSLWDDKANTFYSTVPRLVKKGSITGADLTAAFPEATSYTVVPVDVEVDERGVPRKADAPTEVANSRFRELAVEAALQSLFCPAKPEDKYVAGRVMLMFTTEIRR